MSDKDKANAKCWTNDNGTETCIHQITVNDDEGEGVGVGIGWGWGI